MSRFLSPEWFAQVTAGPEGREGSPEGADRIVFEQLVMGTPYGDVRYAVVVAAGRSWIEVPGDQLAATLTISSDYATVSAIAQGQLSAERALMQGRLRVRGSTERLAGRSAELIGLDPVPAQVREKTTY
jgi:SCP-2 sterol transfer family